MSRASSVLAPERKELPPAPPSEPEDTPASFAVEQEPSLERRYGSAPAVARFQGQASYYSDALAGRPTASGEPYDPQRLTAAHRSLPFGTIVRVSMESGKTVYVRINDRGPFVRGRVLDLSRAAAEHLGFVKRGVARLRAEVVKFGPPKAKRRKSPRR